MDDVKKLAQRVLDDYDWPVIAGHPEPVQALARAVLEQDAELARKDAQIRALREAVEAVEWIRDGIAVYCPWCIELNFDQDERQHAPDCLRQRALAASQAGGQT